MPGPRPIRPLFFAAPELEQILRLFRVCYPERPAVPIEHFIVYPTFVAPHPDDPTRILGYTQLCLNPWGGDLTVNGIDVVVHPDHRREGIGRDLVRFRLAVGRKIGAVAGMGMTRPDNKPMRRLFETEGWRLWGTRAAYYIETTPPADGHIYMAPTELLDAALKEWWPA